MATKIKLKRKISAETTDNSIADVKLEQGEPLFDTNTQTLYIGNSDTDEGDAQKKKNVSVDSATYLRSRDASRTKLLSTEIGDVGGQRLLLPENDKNNDQFVQIGSSSYPFGSITVGKVKKDSDPEGTIKPQIKIDGASITPNTDKVANIGESDIAFAHVYTQQNDANVIQTLDIPNAGGTYSLSRGTGKNDIVVLPALHYDGQLYPNRQKEPKYDNVYQITSGEQAKHFIVNEVEVFIAQVLNYITLNYTLTTAEGNTVIRGGTYISTIVPSSRGTIIADVYTGTPISNYEITQTWTYTTDKTENQDPGPTPSNITSITMSRSVNENIVTDVYHIGSLPPFCSGVYIGLDGAIYTFGTNNNQEEAKDKYWFYSGLVTNYIAPIGSGASIGRDDNVFANIYANTFHGNVTGGDASSVTNVKEITGAITEIKSGATISANSGEIGTNTGNITRMTGGTIETISSEATVNTVQGNVGSVGSIGEKTETPKDVVLGNVTGNVDGSISGNVGGNVGSVGDSTKEASTVVINGSISGSISGNIGGDVQGTIAKAKQIEVQEGSEEKYYTLTLSGTTLTLSKGTS